MELSLGSVINWDGNSGQRLHVLPSQQPMVKDTWCSRYRVFWQSILGHNPFGNKKRRRGSGAIGHRGEDQQLLNAQVLSFQRWPRKARNTFSDAHTNGYGETVSILPVPNTYKATYDRGEVLCCWITEPDVCVNLG